MVALFDAVADRFGDDFGLIAGDAAGGELLGDGERVEHAGSLPLAGLGAKQLAPWPMRGGFCSALLPLT